MASLVITKYKTDGDLVTTIKCLAAVKAVTGNDEPAGTVNSQLLPKISKGNKAYGIRPRFLRLSRTAQVGTDPTDLKTYRTKLIILDKDNFASFSKGSSVTFKGNTWTITEKVLEDY